MRLLACLIVAPQRATMSQQSSLTQSAHSVRQVLTAYTRALSHHPPPRCLRIASNPGGDRRRWFGLRKYEWLVLSDPNLRIGDANRDFGGRITPQERNPPGGKENARADGHGGKTLRRQPARMAQRTDTWHPIAVPCQFTFFLSCITFDVLSTGSSTCESPPGLRLAARISEFVLVGFHIPLP